MLAIAMGLGAFGCATAQKQVQTPHYTLNHPDFWNVKSVAQKEGEPTVVTIGQYGQAIIDDGAGAMASRDQNYESVQSDVEVRIYGWPEPPGDYDPSKAAHALLSKDPELKLLEHGFIPEQPVECGTLKKKYAVFKAQQEPLDLVRRAGHRIIIVGGKASGVLVAVVARVPAEQDTGRYCHNLSNMQVQLQNLLDGLDPVAGKPASGPPPAPVAPAATEPATTPESAAPPASPPAAPPQ